jgi:transposase-like protein
MVAFKELQPQSFDISSAVCPRCGDKLRVDYPDQEPQCLMCGYVRYEYTPRLRRGGSVLETSTQFRLRYAGYYDELRETIVRVSMSRLNNSNGSIRLVSHPECPFCGQLMQLVSLSGKRKERTEDRYRCPEDHRISLLMGPGSEMGWR